MIIQIDLPKSLQEARDHFVSCFGLPLPGETNKAFFLTFADEIVRSLPIVEFRRREGGQLPVPPPREWTCVRRWRPIEGCRTRLLELRRSGGHLFEERSYWTLRDDGLTGRVDLAIDGESPFRSPEQMSMGVNVGLLFPRGQGHAGAFDTHLQMELSYRPGPSVRQERQRRLKICMDEGEELLRRREEVISRVRRQGLSAYAQVKERLSPDDFAVLLGMLSPSFVEGTWIDAGTLDTDEGDVEWMPPICIADERGRILCDQILEIRFPARRCSDDDFLRHSLSWLDRHRREAASARLGRLRTGGCQTPPIGGFFLFHWQLRRDWFFLTTAPSPANVAMVPTRSVPCNSIRTMRYGHFPRRPSVSPTAPGPTSKVCAGPISSGRCAPSWSDGYFVKAPTRMPSGTPFCSMGLKGRRRTKFPPCA